MNFTMFYETVNIRKMLLAVVLSTGSINAANAIGSNSTDGEWQYSLSPLFLWAQGIEGTSVIGFTEAPLEVEFKDALDNLVTSGFWKVGISVSLYIAVSSKATASNLICS